MKIATRVSFVTLVGALCACSATQEETANSSIKPTLSADLQSQWQYVESLSDEFNSEQINLKKWNNNPGSWGPWSWEQDNTWQADGNLNINIKYKPHQTKRRAYKAGGKLKDVELYYTSGILRSYGYQVYGYYEVRMKGVQTFPGSSPAFWIYSLTDEVNRMGLRGKNEGEPTYSEVDIVELTQSEWHDGKHDGPEVIDMNLHTRIIENGKEVWKRPGKFPELTRNKIHADFDPRDDFHVYGAEVTPEKITWYLDGEKVAEKPNLYWHLPMHVTLSLGLRYPHVTYNCDNGFDRCAVAKNATPEGYPSAMQVDWVRVYKKK